MNKYSREDVYDTPEKKLKRDLDLSNKIFLERKNALFEVMHNLRWWFNAVGGDNMILNFAKLESEEDRRAFVKKMIIDKSADKDSETKIEDADFEESYIIIRDKLVAAYELEKYIDEAYSNISNRDIFVDWLYKSGNNIAIKQQIWFMEWYAKTIMDKIKEIMWVDFIIGVQDLLNKTSIHKRNIYDLLNGENRFDNQ